MTPLASSHQRHISSSQLTYTSNILHTFLLILVTFFASTYGARRRISIYLSWGAAHFSLQNTPSHRELTEEEAFLLVANHHGESNDYYKKSTCYKVKGTNLPFRMESTRFVCLESPSSSCPFEATFHRKKVGPRRKRDFSGATTLYRYVDHKKGCRYVSSDILILLANIGNRDSVLLTLFFLLKHQATKRPHNLLLLADICGSAEEPTKSDKKWSWLEYLTGAQSGLVTTSVLMPMTTIVVVGSALNRPANRTRQMRDCRRL